MADDEPQSYNAVLTQTIARHFAAATVTDGVIDLGLRGLRMRCWVNGVQLVGTTHSASLFFALSGGPFAGQLFASTSGYGASDIEAIVVGGCNWACAFGPVLQAGVTGAGAGAAHEFQANADGQPVRVVVDQLDRAFVASAATHEQVLATARRRLAPRGWLVEDVIASGTLPLLRADGANLLSVFVADGSGQRRVEVKVNGVDWPASEGACAAAASSAGEDLVMLRELAVIAPAEAPPRLRRAAVERTLAGVARSLLRRCVAWPGWAAHRGLLAPPMPPDALARLEDAIGPLPTSYRSFLLEVGASGAGPGYGLLPPDTAAQLKLSRGTFAWMHDQEPAGDAAGVLALAHAGCGVMWLLVLRGPHAGEVWVDATGSDGRVRRVAPDFEAWYRGWLDALVRDDLRWIQWDARYCATADALDQWMKSLEQKEGLTGKALLDRVASGLKPGALSLAAGGGPYFERGDALDPCPGCVALVRDIGVDLAVYPPGKAPRQAGDGGRTSAHGSA